MTFTSVTEGAAMAEGFPKNVKHAIATKMINKPNFLRSIIIALLPNLNF
jgi:hypothetical protein